MMSTAGVPRKVVIASSDAEPEQSDPSKLLRHSIGDDEIWAKLLEHELSVDLLLEIRAKLGVIAVDEALRTAGVSKVVHRLRVLNALADALERGEAVPQPQAPTCGAAARKPRAALSVANFACLTRNVCTYACIGGWLQCTLPGGNCA